MKENPKERYIAIERPGINLNTVFRFLLSSVVLGVISEQVETAAEQLLVPVILKQYPQDHQNQPKDHRKHQKTKNETKNKRKNETKNKQKNKTETKTKNKTAKCV